MTTSIVQPRRAAPPPEPAGYRDFARRIVDTGILTDPWIEGAPRFADEPVVLSEAEHRLLCQAGEDLALVLEEAQALLLDDAEQRALFLGLSPTQELMLETSAGLWHAVARADVFFVDDGVQVTEMNSDTPTGEPEAIVLGALCQKPGLVDACAELAPAIAGAWRALHAGFVDASARGQRTAALIYPTEQTDDLALVRLYRALLQEMGFHVVLGSPYNLARDDDGALTLFGEPVTLLVRHYKTDWWGERESAWLDDPLLDSAPLAAPLQAVLAAHAARKLAIVNPFGAIAVQSKRMLAFCWERIHRFTTQAQGIIERIIPYTARLEALHPEQLAADKDAWVLKSDYGAEGDEVVIGCRVDDVTWHNALRLARPGRFVAQRFFSARRDSAGRVRNHGVFVVAGCARGIYTRVDDGLTDPRSLSVPTLLARGARGP
jgi:glutathionylspermidine synthase